MSDDLRAKIEKVRDEMRVVAIVSGQSSVEGPYDLSSAMAAREAGRVTRWADELEAVLSAASPQSNIPELVLRDLDTRIFYAETSLQALVDAARLYRRDAAEHRETVTRNADQSRRTGLEG